MCIYLYLCVYACRCSCLGANTVNSTDPWECNSCLNGSCWYWRRCGVGEHKGSERVASAWVARCRLKVRLAVILQDRHLDTQVEVCKHILPEMHAEDWDSAWLIHFHNPTWAASPYHVCYSFFNSIWYNKQRNFHWGRKDNCLFNLMWKKIH